MGNYYSNSLNRLVLYFLTFQQLLILGYKVYIKNHTLTYCNNYYCNDVFLTA